MPYTIEKSLDGLKTEPPLYPVTLEYFAVLPPGLPVTFGRRETPNNCLWDDKFPEGVSHRLKDGSWAVGSKPQKCARRVKSTVDRGHRHPLIDFAPYFLNAKEL